MVELAIIECVCVCLCLCLFVFVFFFFFLLEAAHPISSLSFPGGATNGKKRKVLEAGVKGV